MQNLTRASGFTAPGAALFAACMLPVVLTYFATLLPAQDPSTRLVHVTVTDPMGRFVTGLGQETFEVVENGTSRPITGFLATTPISVAVVGDVPVRAMTSYRPGDELLQARSLSDALRQLAASKNVRKAVVLTTASDTSSVNVPSDTQIVRSSPFGAFRDILELRNQYLVQFDSANNSAAVEVVLHQPRGMPRLRSNLK